MVRTLTGQGALLRQGFLAPDDALVTLSELGPEALELVAITARTADPDGALDRLGRLAAALEAATPGAASEMLRALANDEGTAMRLLSVLGASEALGDHLVRHPDQWAELTDPALGCTRPAAYALREAMLRAVGADPRDPSPTATLPDADALVAMRVEYRRHLLRLAARDLAHHLGVDDAAAELSDLAAAALEAALAVARQRVGGRAGDVRLAIVAMGKCGGHELNYVSDVDVVFAYAPGPGLDDDAANRVATQLASHLMRACSEPTREGELWPVDAALRPEGKAGPLVRTVASHLGYYERWANTWEFQALLKARPVAGDLDLGREYVDAVRPLVWTAAEREGFVDDVRAMRRRVLDHIPAREAERQLKLGSGGLRDVEFAVQLLQLVHGRADESLRDGATLSALARLTEGGYIGREDGETLHAAYAFLRTLEHRMQLHRLRRTHVVPDDAGELRRLGRGLGMLREPVASLDAEWQHHRREVRRLHQKLFYRPLLGAVAQLPSAEARLSPEAARSRLAALGYVDADAALRHLEALTAGVSRKAQIQRTLLPVLLQWFAEGPDPDGGLSGFRRISDSLGSTPWFLATLRDEGEVAERLATILAGSRYATSLLEREPQGVRMLAGDLAPRSAETLTDEMAAASRRRDDPDRAVQVVRGVRRRELFRIAAGELLGLTDVADVGAGLSRLVDATLETTLAISGDAVRRQRGLDAAPARLAIVAMGRYGGFELSYASDADVLFVHEPVEGADPHEATAYAQAVAHDLSRRLGVAGPDPALVVDADLRPEGRQGALVRSLESYAAYYARWSKVWEAQALLRADAVVGDPDLRGRFTELVDPLRYPAAGLAADDVLEVRRIKARVDAERLPRGADPATHLKLGRGGLADVEWTVQLLQMRYAGQVPGLRTPRTLPALEAARDAGLVDRDDAGVLAETWRWVSRVRNAVTLVRGKGSDQLPADARELASVAAVLGYPGGSTQELLNDHLRHMRRARAVVDRVFWES